MSGQIIIGNPSAPQIGILTGTSQPLVSTAPAIVPPNSEATIIGPAPLASAPTGFSTTTRVTLGGLNAPFAASSSQAMQVSVGALSPGLNSVTVNTVQGTELWFLDQQGNCRIWRLTTSGTMTPYSFPSPISPTGGMCLGPDGNVWVVDANGSPNKLWRITPALSPVFTSFSFSPGNTLPSQIVVGPDGNLWVSDGGAGSIAAIWKVTTGGVFVHYTNAGKGGGDGIVSGVDGNLWVTDTINGYIWSFTTSGVGTSYNIATTLGFICTGPDGNIWGPPLSGSNFLYKISYSGVLLNTYTIGSGGHFNKPGAGGADGNIWIGDANNGGIWKVTPAGVGTFYPMVDHITGPAIPGNLCLGPDGNFWVIDSNDNVWRVTLSGGATSYAVPGGIGVTGITSGF